MKFLLQRLSLELNPQIKLKISKNVDKLIKRKLERLLESQFDSNNCFLIFISVRSTQTTLEVNKLNMDSPLCEIEYKISLPYQEINRANNVLEAYLNYLFEGFIIMLRDYSIPENNLRALLEEIKEEILNNSDYVYPKPIPTYEELQILLKDRGINDKVRYQQSIINELNERSREELDWQDSNDLLHTQLFKQSNTQISRADLITLKKDEYPLLECSLPNDNYFLMTTDYVYSYFMHYLTQTRYLQEMWFYSGTDGFNNPELGNKTELHAVKLTKTNKSLLLFEIGAGNSGYYAKELFKIILEKNDL